MTSDDDGMNPCCDSHVLVENAFVACSAASNARLVPHRTHEVRMQALQQKLQSLPNPW